MKKLFCVLTVVCMLAVLVSAGTMTASAIKEIQQPTVGTEPEVTATATNTEPTGSSDVFDWSSFAGKTCLCADCMCGANKVPYGIGCDHYVCDGFTIFKWCGDGDRMVDYTDDPDLMPGPFNPYMEPLAPSRVLFLNGVPNLGDYLFFFKRSVTSVYIPNTVTEIAEHTFSRFSEVKIYCNAGSYAAQFAQSHDLECHLLDTGEVIMPTIVRGDANGDGARNMKDVLMLRKHLAEMDAEYDAQNADCNADDEVNMKDVLMLRKHLAGYYV